MLTPANRAEGWCPRVKRGCEVHIHVLLLRDPCPISTSVQLLEHITQVCTTLPSTQELTTALGSGHLEVSEVGRLAHHPPRGNLPVTGPAHAGPSNQPLKLYSRLQMGSKGWLGT